MLTALLIWGSLCQAEPVVPEFQLQYVRPAGDKYDLECEVALKKSFGGFHYQSVTHRPKEKMKLTLVWDKHQRLQSAELEQATAQGKMTATVAFQDKAAIIKRPGKEAEHVAFVEEPVLATTAPDWSDIWIAMARYDQKKGGKQKFAGLWFHPVKPALSLTFTVELLGHDTIASAGQKLTLGRFRVHLRSGDYLVWASAKGKVYKLMPPGQPQSAVILKGQEEATLALTGADK
jgi:hypothetical protein